MPDVLCKTVVIGNEKVGKSSLLHRLTKKTWLNCSYTATIGVDFGSMILRVKDKEIKYQIWDTAGKGSFRSITKSYYSDAGVALLCFSLEDESTLSALQGWRKDFVNYNEKDAKIILVATKNDLEDKKLSETDVAQKLEEMKLTQFPLIYTSAKEDDGCQNLIDMMGEIGHEMAENAEINLSAMPSKKTVKAPSEEECQARLMKLMESIVSPQTKFEVRGGYHQTIVFNQQEYKKHIPHSVKEILDLISAAQDNKAKHDKPYTHAFIEINDILQERAAEKQRSDTNDIISSITSFWHRRIKGRSEANETFYENALQHVQQELSKPLSF